MKKALSFDDVLLVPKYSEIASRKDPDTSVKLSNKLVLKIPVISSCMDTVTETNMAVAMWNAGGLGIVHRYNTIEQQEEMAKQIHAVQAKASFAIGATGDFYDRTSKLFDKGVDTFCIDVAHGNSALMEKALQDLRKEFSDNITIIAGNVATPDGCRRLVDAGTDAIRLGIGGGSLCTTRIMTGHGIPTLQTIIDCHERLNLDGIHGVCLIADGGIKNSGDIVKSMAAGAHAVILGQLLAATTEAPGELIPGGNGKPPGWFKRYRGMASFDAQADWRPDKKNDIVPEGEATLLSYKGPVDKILHNLIGGLRSGMTYSNARTLKELQENAEFVQITSAGMNESRPHAKRD